MIGNAIRCLITDGTWAQNPERWTVLVARWISAGIEFVQIRERNLNARELAALTRKILRFPNPLGTKILLNDRADVAIACGAHGVHLRDGSVEPAKFARPGFLVTISCHSADDAAKTLGADFALLGPIFKPLSKAETGPALGAGAITEFTRRCATPVLALGGITEENARACMDAGAVGIAGITCFGQ